MKLNGAAILIECLIEQGVGTVFGFPGGAVLPIYDELYKRQDRIHHVLTAHEQRVRISLKRAARGEIEQ